MRKENKRNRKAKENKKERPGHTVRFGSGEFELPREGLGTLSEMRSCFLQVACLEVPEFLSDLQQDLVPAFKQIHLYCCMSTRTNRRILSNYMRTTSRPIRWKQIEDESYLHIAKLKPHQIRAIAEFRLRLMEWSRRYNVDEEWCRESAFETLDLWFHKPCPCKEKLWYWDDLTLLHPEVLRETRQFIFKFETLYPFRTSRKEFENHIREAFESKLKDYLKAADSSARDHGGLPTMREIKLEHFRWLVMHQVKKAPMTGKQIFEWYKAKSHSEDLPHIDAETTVVRAVKRLADEIGLTPRYVGRGRKPKKKKRE
jgi:hypothetical protein